MGNSSQLLFPRSGLLLLVVLAFSGMAVTGAADPIFNPANGHHYDALAFIPSSIGERRGTLTISHNAVGSPTSMSLCGIGPNPPPAVPSVSAAGLSATSLAFG